jgi:hypothetical protein
MPAATDGIGCISEPDQQPATLAIGWKTHIGFGRHDNEDTAYVASGKFARNLAGFL